MRCFCVEGAVPGRCACTVQFTEKTLQKRLTKGGAAGIITHVAGHKLNMWGISSAGSPVGIKTHPQSDSPATINSQQKTPSKRFASWILWGISSAGRALAWHARGHRFDPGILHHKDLSENSGRSFFAYSIISALCMQRTHPPCHTPRKTPRHAGRCPARGAGRPASARRGLQPLNCPA